MDESDHSNGWKGDKPWNDADVQDEEEVSRSEEESHSEDELEWKDDQVEGDVSKDVSEDVV